MSLNLPNLEDMIFDENESLRINSDNSKFFSNKKNLFDYIEFFLLDDLTKYGFYQLKRISKVGVNIYNLNKKSIKDKRFDLIFIDELISMHELGIEKIDSSDVNKTYNIKKIESHFCYHIAELYFQKSKINYDISDLDSAIKFYKKSKIGINIKDEKKYIKSINRSLRDSFRDISKYINYQKKFRDKKSYNYQNKNYRKYKKQYFEKLLEE